MDICIVLGLWVIDENIVDRRVRKKPFSYKQSPYTLRKLSKEKEANVAVCSGSCASPPNFVARTLLTEVLSENLAEGLSEGVFKLVVKLGQQEIT